MNLLVQCPVCDEEQEHQVLKENGSLLVKCTECGHVHRTEPPQRPSVIEVRAVVSRETESKMCTIELLSDEECSEGDLLVADCGDEAMGVEVTGIEVGDGRVARARADAISTLWTRLIDEVVVRASVHDGRKTIPVYARADGEEEFSVGEVVDFDRVRFRITQIKMREGQVLRKEGWKTLARKIKRIYGVRL
ncbi:MAG TPA: hypothetical protein ENN85_05995 [Methanoculleus sp.]|nr:hypothetical protein [Methanoculleus sp.]